MLPFLLLAALVLSGFLLSDLVGGLRRSEDSALDQWQRAMSALSTPVPRGPVSPTETTEAPRYDLAA